MFEYLNILAKQKYGRMPRSFRNLVSDENPHLVFYQNIFEDPTRLDQQGSLRGLETAKQLLQGKLKGMCRLCDNMYDLHYTGKHERDCIRWNSKRNKTPGWNMIMQVLYEDGTHDA